MLRKLKTVKADSGSTFLCKSRSDGTLLTVSFNLRYQGKWGKSEEIPLLWRGRGGSGLLRSARNDAKRGTKAVSLTSIA